MRVIIVEDEPSGHEILSSLLHELFDDIKILGIVGLVKEAVPLIKKHQPDLVFLDIELPLENGFTLLDHFDTVPFKIIFTTSYEEYAIQALRISAIDYLLKPIDPEELKEAIEKAKNSISDDQPEQLKQFREHYLSQEVKLPLATVEGYRFIKITDIVYCKADRRYTLFYLQDGSKHITAKNIGKFEPILKEHHFMRVHHSQIINLNKVEQINKCKPMEVVLEGGIKVLVSKARRDALLNFFKLI